MTQIISKLFGRFGWVRMERLYSERACDTTKLYEAYDREQMLRRCLQELRAELRNAVRPTASLLTKSLRSSTVQSLEDYTKMHRVYRLRVPEYTLVCDDNNWFVKFGDSNELKMALVDVWCEEFRRIVPELLKGIR